MLRVIWKWLAAMTAGWFLAISTGLPAEAKESHPCPDGSVAFVHNAVMTGKGTKGGDKAKGYTYTQKGRETTVTVYAPYQLSQMWTYTHDVEPDATPSLASQPSIKSMPGYVTIKGKWPQDFTKMKLCLKKIPYYDTTQGKVDAGGAKVMNFIMDNMGYIAIGVILLVVIAKAVSRRRGDT